ncbi:MAG: 30S ribosomal protein S6 [Candidatus Sungbacteria bacterium]|nr:30S ribosomal protein S6 [Candidatus Sungbacteria bacterium]
METEPKKYEIAYLISPNVPEEDALGEAGKISGLLQDAKSVIGHVEEPRRRRLAYPIKKSRECYFGWTRFSCHPENIPDFEKKLKLEPQIIRYLLVEAEEIPVDTRLPRMTRTPFVQQKAQKNQTGEEKEKMDIVELDKKLEEILGK